MRLFLFQWPVASESYLNALNALEREGHELAYFVYSGRPGEMRRRFPRAVFHEHERALDGIPPDELSGLATPPDAALIREMYQSESLILSMMNKHFDWMSIDERKQAYYSILGYWEAVFAHYRPGALIFHAVPHSVYDYLAYELAKKRGIRTILFDYTLIGDRYLCMTDFRKGSERLLRIFERLKGEHITPEDLFPDVREYYRRARGESSSDIPLYIAEDKKRYSFLNTQKLRATLVLRAVKDRSVFKKALFFFLKAFGEHISREYRSVARIPDLSVPFVYVPLNYQPECTTSPQGDIFVVQTLMLEMLSQALPQGWRLYVKEHPSQWGPRGLNFSSSRYRGYYRRVARIPGVTVVPINTRHALLVEHAKAVATVSGTVGLEALFRQKPAVIFGYPWYQNAPALLRADSIESCRQCFEKIANGMEIREEENCRFLKAIEEGTVPGHFQDYSIRHSTVTPEASARAVVQVILEALH